MRLGYLEKMILQNILGMKRRIPLYDILIDFKNRRGGWADGIPLLRVRNRLFFLETITPSQKSSFSRTLRRLEKKGLIITRNHVSEAIYRTHVWITDEGEEAIKLTFDSHTEKLTSMEGVVGDLPDKGITGDTLNSGVAGGGG